jgi:ATP-dependent protease ClpP protease subunit
MFIKVFVGLLFLGLNVASAADITVHRPKNGDSRIFLNSCASNTLVLRNEISSGDSVKLSNAIAQVKSRYPQDECMGGVLAIQLSSTGGDVEEAMKLGKIIRQHEIRIIVPVTAKCFSACVLVIAGGVERATLGQVGVHRPYFVTLDSRASPSEVKTQRDAMNSKIRAYLNAMDVSANLLEMMLSVPPDAIKVLTEDELQQFRLSITDAAFDERQVAKQAYRYGLNSSEYRKRSAVANQQCPMSNASGKLNPGWDVCQLAVMLSISKSAALTLNTLVLDRCGDEKMSDSESRECERKTLTTGR